MNLHKIQLSIFFLANLAIGSCQAAIINFDDVSFPGGNPMASSILPPGYQGFNWSGGHGDRSWVVSPNDATDWYNGTKQPYSHSGNNFAWSNEGRNLELSISEGSTFDLKSFWIRIWPNNSVNVTAQGFLNGSEMFTQTFETSDNYIQITTNFDRINRFTLIPQVPYNLLIDDISITNSSSVPIPASAWLFSSVLVGFGVIRKRRAA